VIREIVTFGPYQVDHSLAQDGLEEGLSGVG
jgi:hypothetical protein